MILSVLQAGEGIAQGRGKAENSPGVVIFKRYAWSPDTDLLAAEFIAYVDRRAEFQSNKGYVQFRLPRNQVRQVGADSIVEIIHFSEISTPATLLTASDEVALRDRLAIAERLANYSDAISAIVGPYLAALRNDLTQFADSRIKINNAWLPRKDHINAQIEKILTDVRSGSLIGRKELESRIKALQSEGHSGSAFETALRGLREAWLGIRLDRVAAAFDANRGRAAADMIEEVRMDLGATPMPDALMSRMNALSEQAAEFLVSQRRAELLAELRNPITSDGRKNGVLRELDAMGVSQPDDAAFLETIRSSLAARQSANRTLAALIAEANSLFDTASLRQAETGAYFRTGDTSLQEFSSRLNAAWKKIPASETGTRTSLADLQTLIETAGRLNFHLSGKDWKAVPDLAVQLRDVSQRVGAGATFLQSVEGQLADRRLEVDKVIADAASFEAAGNQSEAFLLYLKASEILPDERATSAVRRLRQEALGL